MSTPIGDAAEAAATPEVPPLMGDRPENTVVSGDPTAPDENPPETPTPLPELPKVPETSTVSDLMAAQNDFIHAQMAYIHTKDLGALATAQENYIIALTGFLESLGAL